MRTEEDEAFDELAKRQGMWGGGFHAKRAAAADKQREWVGLTDEEIGKQTILAGFNPEWKIEIGMVFSIVRNLEAKLKEKNNA